MPHFYGLSEKTCFRQFSQIFLIVKFISKSLKGCFDEVVEWFEKHIYTAAACGIAFAMIQVGTLSNINILQNVK